MMKNDLPKTNPVLKTNNDMPVDSLRIAFFSTKTWVRNSFAPLEPKLTINGRIVEFTFLEPWLDLDTVSLAAGHEVICAFVNDQLDAPVLERLVDLGVKLIALRCAGFNNVDIHKAAELGLAVVRVPAYSPYAVAEHALGMIMALNRRYHRAYNRIREGNFSLDGLLGFDIRGKTIGVIGTGRIGQVFIDLLLGFGVRILAYDKFPNLLLQKRAADAYTAAENARSQGKSDSKANFAYVELEALYRECDIISLHCPLTHETYHMINSYSLQAMKKGVMIINTSRGPLIDTEAVIDGLKTGQIGYLGLDVYEEEHDLFFEDLSDQVIQDDVFVRLESFHNVLITAHQAFFTREAVDNIASITMANINEFITQGTAQNQVKA